MCSNICERKSLRFWIFYGDFVYYSLGVWNYIGLEFKDLEYGFDFR